MGGGLSEQPAKALRPLTGNRPKAGFSLIESAAVLFIAGLVLMGIIDMYHAYQKGDYVSTNQQRMATIKQAIQAFYDQNYYLPCASSLTLPQSDPLFGRGDAIDGGKNTALNHPTYLTAVAADCKAAVAGTFTVASAGTNPIPAANPVVSTVRVGGVPVRSLGLPDEDAYNPEGFRYIYAVSENVARLDYLHPPTQTDPYLDLSLGQITALYPGTGTQLTTPPGSVLWIMIDPGKDGNGAYMIDGTQKPCTTTGVTAEEINNNCHATTTSTFYYGDGLTYQGGTQ